MYTSYRPAKQRIRPTPASPSSPGGRNNSLSVRIPSPTTTRPRATSACTPRTTKERNRSSRRSTRPNAPCADDMWPSLRLATPAYRSARGSAHDNPTRTPALGQSTGALGNPRSGHPAPAVRKNHARRTVGSSSRHRSKTPARRRCTVCDPRTESRSADTAQLRFAEDPLAGRSQGARLHSATVMKDHRTILAGRRARQLNAAATTESQISHGRVEGKWSAAPASDSVVRRGRQYTTIRLAGTAVRKARDANKYSSRAGLHQQPQRLWVPTSHIHAGTTATRPRSRSIRSAISPRSRADTLKRVRSKSSTTSLNGLFAQTGNIGRSAVTTPTETQLPPPRAL